MSGSGSHGASSPDRGAARPAVLLTTDFKPNTGGIAAYLHQLWEGAATEAPATVYSTVPVWGEQWPRAYDLRAVPSPGPRAVGTMPGDGIALIRRLNTARYFLRHRRAATRLVHRLLAEHGSSVDIFIGLWGLESHFWCAALRRAGIPYVLFVHGAEVTAPFYGRLPAWRAHDFGAACAIIGPSRGTADMVRARLSLEAAPAVVAPGVSESASGVGVQRSAASVRSTLGIADANDGLLLLTVARLVRRKGVDLVLRRVAELAPEFPTLHYVVAGDGPERSTLESLAVELGIRDRVHFLGAVDDATRNELYGASDLFVTLNRELAGSEFEGFGIVFLEAGLAGLPVIGGRNGGVPDAIEHRRTGLLVDPENALESRDALRLLLRDAERRREMGRAGRARALSRFSWAEAQRQFAAIRRKVASDAQ